MSSVTTVVRRQLGLPIRVTPKGEPQQQSFDTWKQRVNGWVISKTGLTTDDLPTWDYRAAYTDGIDPRNAAEQAIKASGGF